MKLRSAFYFTISLVLSLIPVAPALAQTQSSNQKQPQAGENAPDMFLLSEKAYHSQSANGDWVRDLGYFSQNQGAELLWAWTGENSQTAGLSLASADDALRSHLKLPKDQGLVVSALDPHSFAHQAGIRPNDVLLKLGETPLGKPEDLEKQLKSVGEKPVTLHLLRLGKATAIRVQPQIRVTLRPVPPKPPENQYWIGISVSQLDPALRSQLQLPPRQGLIVNEVVKDSPAAKVDFKMNDILFELDGKPMSDSPKLVDVVQTHGEKPILFHVIREGKLHLSVEVTPERRKASQLTARSDQLYSAVFGYVQPGAVETGPISKAGGSGTIFYNPSDLHVTTSSNNPANQNQPGDASAGVTKRLDALDAELKQLRTAIEELSKVMKDKK